jgi:nucleoside-diphosphate-sugar epimerase
MSAAGLAIDPALLRGRPVLVTGSGGFVGSAVTRRLVELGADVRGLAGPASEAASLRRPPPGVRVAHGEIDDRALLAELVAGVDVVYHAAGPPSVAASFDAPARYLRVHAAGTAALLEACAAAGVGRLVHVSSAEVYGPAVGEVAEDHPRAPRSPYGVAKLAAELVIETWAARAGFLATVIRPFSLYGPGSSPRSLVAQLLAQLADPASRSLRVADPRPVRDHCFIDDAADAIARAGLRQGEPVRAYNLASGHGASVADVARALARAAGRGELPLEVAESDRPDAAVTLALIGNPARARAELAIAAATSLDDGLARTWNAWSGGASR